MSDEELHERLKAVLVQMEKDYGEAIREVSAALDSDNLYSSSLHIGALRQVARDKKALVDALNGEGGGE